MSSIAVINAGSSSIKFAVFEATTKPVLLMRGQVEGIGSKPRAKLLDAEGNLLVEEHFEAKGFDHAAAARAVMRIGSERMEGRKISAVGHRVVHGGSEFSVPIMVTREILEKLKSFIPLAPLHQPHNLAAIGAVLASHPTLPQVACFDTAFHSYQPSVARAFAIPRKYAQEGIRRYGFHGISYAYVMARLKTITPEIAEGRIIVAHLGNGASLCAVKAGRSIASTMGFTAADGLMMGTRCGALDPGVLVYFIDQYGFNARDLEDLIYRKSGLLGVSQISPDMRSLRASSDPAAKEAIDLFVYRIIREVGSLTAALGGLDAIIFTGGIGENDSATRAEIANGCTWLGLTIDEAANLSGANRITGKSSRIAAYVIPTNEELEIAERTFEMTIQ